jgi:MoaA/NifB/PqqE/SkfB family radical SAM enzyme
MLRDRALRSARRTLVPIYQNHARKIHEIRSLFLEVTRACNLACLHCGSDCSREGDGAHLDPGLALAVLTEIRGRYDPHEITVSITGGEPLCYPGLFELGRAITDLEFPWGIVTNGFAWTRDTMRSARSAGMQSIAVSLDGLPENHDWLRGRKGSFDRALAAIRMLAAEPFYQAMDVVTCVNRRNLREMDRLRDLLASTGARAWRLFTISPIGRATGQEDLFLTPDEYHILLNSIVRWRGEGGPMDVHLSESGYLGDRFECRVRDGYHFCRAGISVAGIMADGEILACPNIDRRFAQGNVHENSFVDVWENRFAPFRDRRWMQAACADCAACPEWKGCQGNSFHLWNLDEGRPRVCHYRDYHLNR